MDNFRSWLEEYFYGYLEGKKSSYLTDKKLWVKKTGYSPSNHP